MFRTNVNVNPSRKKMQQLFGSAGYQQEQTTPPTSSPLGALAKKVGGEKKDVQKVTIVGGGGGAGDEGKKSGPKHGDRHPYHQESGVDTMVWDSVKKTWVRRGVLSPSPDKVIIDTAPSKKKPEK